jgi:hypothetical protein
LSPMATIAPFKACAFINSGKSSSFPRTG